MVEKILNITTPYGKIRASHEGSLHSSTLRNIHTKFEAISCSSLQKSKWDVHVCNMNVFLFVYSMVMYK